MRGAGYYLEGVALIIGHLVPGAGILAWANATQSLALTIGLAVAIFSSWHFVRLINAIADGRYRSIFDSDLPLNLQQQHNSPELVAALLRGPIKDNLHR
jgi:hypothetical protein